MTRPALLIAAEANLAFFKLSVQRGRNHNPECEAWQ